MVSVDPPIFMADGDAEYTISLSGVSKGLQYNIAYIIDRSGSMGGSRIVDAKNAYIELTNQLVSLGIADVARFAVIPFNSGATLLSPLTAEEAILAVSGIGASGGTSFGPALSQAADFFSTATTGQVNIAYFLSDGFGSGASDSLTNIANVQAFGIGSGANLAALNIIDSDDAVILNSSSQLVDVLTGSSVDIADIDRIELYLDGTLVDTINASQLTDGLLGLSYTGTISGLDTSASAQNQMTATVFLSDGTQAGDATLSIASACSATSEQIIDGTLFVNFNAPDIDYQVDTSQVTSFNIIANDLNNTIIATEGQGIISAGGGDDTIIRGANANSTQDVIIDGGEGFDIVQYFGNFANYIVSKVGSLIQVGTNTDTLSNVELLQFDDVVVETENLVVLPLVSLSSSNVDVTEGTASANFTFTLSQVANENIEVFFATRDGSAVAVSDYHAANGSVVIAAGETDSTISIDLVNDFVFEGPENFFIDFSIGDGGRFSDGRDTGTGIVTIKDNDAIIGTEGRDRITGTEGDDEIRSLGGQPDQITGGGGRDRFVFGAEASNGERDVDVILDFSPTEDIIVLQDGAEIVDTYGKNGALVLVLDDGLDLVIIQGTDLTVDSIAIVDESDMFLF